MSLNIKDLHVEIEDKSILKGVDLEIMPGKIHALMGPNGSGKSTLSYALMGHPKYTVTRGDIRLDGKSIINIPVHERARSGVFLSFQYPVSVPGVPLREMLRESYKNIKGTEMSPARFIALLKERSDKLCFDHAMFDRFVNSGLSGGEKKKSEILQMSVLEPRYAILDETDSGLDVDALRIVAEGVRKLLNPNMGILIITHYRRILDYVKPDHVHVLVNGTIAKSGGIELVDAIDGKGYAQIEA